MSFDNKYEDIVRGLALSLGINGSRSNKTVFVSAGNSIFTIEFLSIVVKLLPSGIQFMLPKPIGCA
jgi:hypothetical protein